MRPTATDGSGVICPCVAHDSECSKTAELIEMPLGGGQTRASPRNHASDGVRSDAQW